MCFASIHAIEQKLTPYESQILNSADNARRSVQLLAEARLDTITPEKAAHQEEILQELEERWCESVQLLKSSPGYAKLEKFERELLEEEVFGWPPAA